jgi:hypothetical protein
MQLRLGRRFVALSLVGLSPLMALIPDGPVAAASADEASDSQSASSEAATTTSARTTREVAVPDAPGLPAATGTSAQIRARVEALTDARDRRDDEAQRGVANRPAPRVGALPRPTAIAAESEVLSVPRNVPNSVAPGVSSTLAEPATAADGRSAIYSGNTYFSRTTDDGATWTQETIPGGPADAPNVCCDPDVVYSPATDTIFNIMLYTNAAQTNGVVRIWVRDDGNSPHRSDGRTPSVDCTYTIDPGGAADNLLPDYPHIAVSDNFLYLSTNNITSGTWTSSQVRRYSLSELSTCSTAGSLVYTYTGTVGQRVIVPVDGATSIMYWGLLDDSSTFRVFSWPESSTSITSVTRTLTTASNFTNPDCRGGTGNFDFIERATAWSITGFRLRGAVGGGRLAFLWPSNGTGGITNAHLRGIYLFTSTLDKAGADPAVWTGDRCFSFPAMSADSSGRVALVLAHGGGTAATAAQTAVLLDDTVDNTLFFPTYFTVAVGTHNRTDDRFGDYFTVHQGRCGNTFVATGYALNGGTAAANVNARYVGLQSDGVSSCTSPK